MLAYLWVGEGAKAVAPMEAGIAGRLTLLHATEERLEGPLDIPRDGRPT